MLLVQSDPWSIVTSCFWFIVTTTHRRVGARVQLTGSLRRRAVYLRAPRGAGLAMAMLAFLQCDPVVGAKWTDIQFKGAVDCLTANGLTAPEDLANIQFEDLQDADSLPALSKGVLRRALDRATVAGAKASSPGAAGPAHASVRCFGCDAAEFWAGAERGTCRHRRGPGPDHPERPSAIVVAEAAARLSPGALARIHSSLSRPRPMRWPPRCSAQKPRASSTRLSIRSSRSFSLYARAARAALPTMTSPRQKR